MSQEYTELLIKYQHVVNKYYAEKEIMTYVCNQQQNELNRIILEYYAEKEVMTYVCNQQQNELNRIILEYNELKCKYEELQLMHNSAVILSKMRK